MAATIIDQLVVKLDLDSSDFNKGQKGVAGSLDDTRKATDRLGDDIAASGKKAAEFFSQIEKAAIKFFAVLTVGRGLSDFTRTIVGTGAQLDRMSGRLGTSVDTLSRWQGAVRQSGGTGEGFLSTMQNLSQAMTELQLTGNTGMLPFLQKLGVSVVDANGKAKLTVDLLKDIGDAANARIANPADRFNILQSMGIDEGSINLMMKGATERDKLLNSQKGYSDADAKAAREAQEKWEGVKLQIERTSQAIVIELLPLLERISKNMLKFAEIAVPVLLQVGDAIGDLHDKTDGWSTALIGVLATLRIIGGAGILGSITKLGGALGLLAVGGAGYAGVKAGEQINDKLSDNTKDKIGEYIARTLAFFGNKEAIEAVRNNSGGYEEFVPAAHSIAPGAPQPPAAHPDASSVPSYSEINNAYGSARPMSDAVSSPLTPAQQPSVSRAERNNNPGNLEFRGQSGAVPEAGSGRFAKFETAADGVSALVGQLRRYGAQGRDTISKIIAKYAPASENDTQAYIAALSKRMSVGADQALNLNDAGTLSGLVKGISRHESGSDFLSDQDVMTGIQRAGVSGGSSGGGSISIGEVKVYTQATDANGIARDMKGAIIRQADTGVR